MLNLIIQERQGVYDSNGSDDDIVAIIDKLLEYKCITSTRHKK